MQKYYHFITPMLLFFIMCLLLLFISRINYTWEDWAPATCVNTSVGCFCEQIGEGIVKQPVNSWSSLSFVLAGFLLLSQTSKDRHSFGKINLLTSRFVYGLIFAISLIITGLGSAFYHASLSFAGQTTDVIGMYFLISFVIVYNILRVYRIKETSALQLYIFLMIILIIIPLFYPEIRRYIFATAVIFALFLEYVNHKKKASVINTKYMLIAFFVFLFSFVIWLMDTFKILCDPESLFQGHAIWHLGGAIAAVFLFLYYRSENSASILAVK